MEKLEIVRLYSLPIHDLQPLVKESRDQGFEFVDRLVIEYEKEINQFNKIGEALFGVYNNQQLIAIGGLNIDPYANETNIARVRHVYVLSKWRRKGVGKQLIQRIIGEASHQFCLLTLRTFNEQAAEFYRAIGFQTEP